MTLAKSLRICLSIVAFAITVFAPRPMSAQISIGISVGYAPPVLPVYEQPFCPGEGYIWTPGYWAWDDDGDDYFWVPGTWVLAPEIGFLWTPGYWGFERDRYFWHEGYWGREVGFYGGVVYGFGYSGRGYEGGRWEGDRFFYNRSVNNVTNITNVYNTTVVNNVNVTRVSYNGGRGGVEMRPTAHEEQVAREQHVPRVSAQNQHLQEARSNRELRASENHGKPPIAATARPGSFRGEGVIAARAGSYNPPPNRGANRGNTDRTNETSRPPENRAANNPNRPPNGTGRNENNRAERNADRPSYVHPNEAPKHDRPAPDANANKKYQQQQQKLEQKQDQEHQKLQQRQEQEHQRAPQQRADAARQQQMEQRHQQQTQKMEQRHDQQQQKLEQHQRPQPQSRQESRQAPHAEEKRN